MYVVCGMPLVSHSDLSTYIYVRKYSVHHGCVVACYFNAHWSVNTKKKKQKIENRKAKHVMYGFQAAGIRIVLTHN